ncbi:MAG: LysE family transporter [Chitinophagales bacterium]
MELIIKGIVAGLAISIMVGPIFFGLIQISVERGIRAGIVFASGIWLSDIFYVYVVQKGFGFIGEDPKFILSFGIIGALILVAFGIGIYMSSVKKPLKEEIGVKNGAGYFIKGVFINLFNPAVLIIWVGIFSNISTFKVREQWFFVVSMLSVVAITDILKIVFASQIGSQLNEARLKIVKNTSAVTLASFGLFLLVRTLLKVA